VVRPAVGLDDDRRAHQLEIDPGDEVAVIVGHNELLDELDAGRDEQPAGGRLELGGRRLVPRLPLLHHPPEGVHGDQPFPQRLVEHLVRPVLADDAHHVAHRPESVRDRNAQFPRNERGFHLRPMHLER
jgi:hypothetical protein